MSSQDWVAKNEPPLGEGRVKRLVAKIVAAILGAAGVAGSAIASAVEVPDQKSPLLLVGPVESVNSTKTVAIVLGQKVLIRASDSIALGDTVVVYGEILTDESIAATKVQVEGLYVPGATVVFLSGTVQQVDQAVGRAVVNGLTVDLTSAMSDGVLSPALGRKLQITGTQPVSRGMVVVNGVNSGSKSAVTINGISGGGITAAGISGGGKTAAGISGGGRLAVDVTGISGGGITAAGISGGGKTAAGISGGGRLAVDVTGISGGGITAAGISGGGKTAAGTSGGGRLAVDVTGISGGGITAAGISGGGKTAAGISGGGRLAVNVNSISGL
jgi:hypothetical protein